MGKPEASFFSSALSTLNMKFDTQLRLQGEIGTLKLRRYLGNIHSNFYCADLCMIGDDVRDDVLGGINCGMMGCLVKTGKFTPKDEEYASGAMVFDNFPQAVHSWFG